MKPSGFLNTFFDEWGFAGPKDYFATVLGFKTIAFFNLQVLGTIVTAIFAFCADWIWNPPGAAFLIVAMTLVNARYGYLVARNIKGESFNWKKFHRTFSICVSDILVMAMIHISIKYYPSVSFMADLLFGWLASHKGIAIYKHMELLQLQAGGLITFLKRHFLKRILDEADGKALVDSLQEKQPELKEETNG